MRKAIFRTKYRVMVAVAAVLTSAVPAMATGLVGLDISTGNIYSVNKSTAALTLLASNVVANGGCLALAPDDQLYSITTGAASNLYKINPATLSATLVGPLGLPFVFEGGLTFSPTGTAYATNANNSGGPQLFTVNLTTGAATVVGTLPGNHDINGLLWRSDGLLAGIDDTTNSLVTINPATAALTSVAALGTTVGGVGDLTMADGIAYFSTGAGGTAPGSDQLWTVNLFTGADSLVGTFSPALTGPGLAGLAAVTVPEPTSLGLCLGIAVGLFSRRKSRAANVKRI